MTDQEIELIKQTMITPGFLLIVKMLDDEFNQKLKTAGKSWEDIAIEAMANEKMETAYVNFTNKLASLNTTKKEEIIYK